MLLQESLEKCVIKRMKDVAPQKDIPGKAVESSFRIE
jgi:hypothetical protein